MTTLTTEDMNKIAADNEARETLDIEMIRSVPFPYSSQREILWRQVYLCWTSKDGHSPARQADYAVKEFDKRFQ